MKIPIPALFLLLLASCLAPKTDKNNIVNQPIPSSKRVYKQYLDYWYNTKIGKSSSVVLELYQDSSFMLAGDFLLLGSGFICCKGVYEQEDNQLLLSVRFKQITQSQSKTHSITDSADNRLRIANIEYWNQLQNFSYLDSLGRVVIPLSENQDTAYLSIDGWLGHITETPFPSKTTKLQTADFLPQPFFDFNNCPDADFTPAIIAHKQRKK